MKKEYMKPEVCCAFIETATFVAASIGTLDSEDKATSEDTPLSRHSYSVWDDEE